MSALPGVAAEIPGEEDAAQHGAPARQLERGSDSGNLGIEGMHGPRPPPLAQAGGIWRSLLIFFNWYTFYSILYSFQLRF